MTDLQVFRESAITMILEREQQLETIATAMREISTSARAAWDFTTAKPSKEAAFHMAYIVGVCDRMRERYPQLFPKEVPQQTG